jgi:hypothetical protein
VEWTGAGNTVFPTRPVGTSDDTPASTQFVNNAVGSAIATANASTGLVLLNTLTASGSTSLVDTTSISSAYNNYKIVFNNIACSVSTTRFGIQVSTNGGVSYIGTSYINTVFGITQLTSVATSGVVGYVQASFDTISNAFAFFLNGDCTLSTPMSAVVKPFQGTTNYVSTAGATEFCNFMGYWNISTTAINALSFAFATSNTITGTISTGFIEIFGMK